jgi:hypothetical protein
MACPVCKELGSGKVEGVAKARAAKTAHVLAIKEAEKALKISKDFSFVDLYTLYFRKIYEHEYERNHYVERERISCFLSIDLKNKPNLCGYHNEFEDGYKIYIHKKVEAKYAKSKWPKPLEK